MASHRISDDYDVGDVLGVGTVGTIFEAIDRKTGERVAIKKLHPSVSSSALIRARFRREMLILDRLHHPNIVRYLGGGEEDGQLYYVMELVDGGTVKELLQANQQLSWPVVVEIGRQLCSALQFAHNHGVIHRDLKPGNLFLTPDGEIKLGDFGIARDIQDADITSSGMTVGTHAYMAPEQITGDEKISGKADLYSLGCCLFEMLVGRTPFVGDNFAQLFDQHLKEPAPSVRSFVPECPPELDRVIHQLLEKDPEDRPFNARAVQAVMLKLDDSGRDEAPSDRGNTRPDVAASSVPSRGRLMLTREIQRQIEATASTHVSWGRIGVLLGLIVAAVTVAVLMVR